MAQKPLVIGWDTETRLIATGYFYPKLVSFQASVEGEEAPDLVCQCEKSKMDYALKTLCDPAESWIRVAHNATFDHMVVAKARPELLPNIFALIEDGRMTCTKIREKLLNLTSTGDMDFEELPDGTTKAISYSLASLVYRYFGVDISAGKTGEDAWRTNYEALEDMPVGEWPIEAVQYAAEDAIWARKVYEKQEEVRAQIIEAAGHDPFETLAFQVAVDFALAFMTDRGVRVDPDMVQTVIEELEAELSGEKVALLFENGIVVPAKPEEPYANGAKAHTEDCENPKTCDCPPKMKKAVPEKLNKGVLQRYVEKLCEARPDEFKLKRNKPTDRHPEGAISIDKGWLEDYAHKDPVLSQYAHRQSLQKMVTTEIPRLFDPTTGELSSVVHPNFDVLKATGRTSSFASKIAASFNCQNVDPRARRCFVPRAGMELFSIDYSAMELGTFAQTCINLFGESKLAEIINSGKDPHAYLGAQIALQSDEHFASIVAGMVDTFDQDAVYELFSELKDDEDTKGFYKYYRTFAKPTGLGYPGGLGAETFVKYAKATYHIEIDLETAKKLKNVWKQTFPEAGMFFDYINNHCKDDLNGPIEITYDEYDEAEDRWITKTKVNDRYKYTTPMGMVRMACDYCAACNGMGLQSPSAEGAKLAVWEVTRECYDKSQGSPLYGRVFPLMFIHDEIVGEIRADDVSKQDLLRRVSERMVECMEVITPDVRAKAEPVLMRRWDKFVDPMFDDDGNLIPSN